jgi:hypothetical protein
MEKSCEGCGAVLPPPTGPVYACAHCGRQHEGPSLGEGQIWLTDEGVWAHLRQTLTGVDSTFLHPSIPAKKMTNVRKVHAAHLPPEEHVLGVYDGTAFGSANDGWVVTSKRLCWRNQLQPSCFLEWKDIDEHAVWVDESRLVVGSAELDTLFASDADGLWAWSEVIRTLARSARPPEAVAAPGPSAPDAGWGDSSVAVAGSGGWGGMNAAAPAGGLPYDYELPELERLSQAPYRVERSPAVVDVHPSGELVLAAGSGVVELRLAQSGQRYRVLPAPGMVLDARLSLDGSWLLVGGSDNRASLFDVRTGAHHGSSPEMSDYCDRVVWLGRTTRFAVASQRGEVWVVDAATMTVVHRLLGPDPEWASLGGLAATADGARLFVSIGTRVGAFDTASGTIVWRVDDALRNAAKLAVSPDGAHLLAAGYDGVAHFDARTGQPGPRYQLRSARAVTWPEPRSGFFNRSHDDDMHWSWSPTPRFSPSGEAVALQDHTGNLVFIDVASGTLTSTPREVGRGFIEDLAWFPDGDHLLLGMSDNTLAVWRARPLTGVMRCEAIGEVPASAWAGVAS